MADVWSIEASGLELAAAGVPGAGEVMLERAVDIAEDQSAGFVLIELVDVFPEEVRNGRNPAGNTLRITSTYSLLASAVAKDAAEAIAFKSSIYVGLANRIATSKLLRSVSHDFGLRRTTFFRMIDNGGRPVIRAACEVTIVHRAKASDWAVAIQPE